MTDLKTLILVIEQRISITERNNQAFVDLPYDTVGAVIALLKEQEHKDRMFHALEEDWKKLKEQKVVRCKDCIYMEKMDVDIREGDLIWCSIHEFGREIDYYCADGEKRE